jgi:hypothetical protein
MACWWGPVTCIAGQPRPRERDSAPPISRAEQRSVTSRRNAAATGWKAVTASPFHTPQFAEQWATEERRALEADGGRDPKA